MPESVRKPDIAEFFRVVWEDWGSRVSGALSVPFTVLALFVNANYAKAIWATLAVLAIVSTLYQVWAKERKERVALSDELERAREYPKPRLSGEIENIITGDHPNAHAWSAFILVSIRNTGAPSIAERYSLTLRLANGTTAMARMCAILPQQLLSGVGLASSGGTISITNQDALYEKTLMPIPSGGIVRGWLHVDFPGYDISRTMLRMPGTRWALTFVGIDREPCLAALELREGDQPTNKIDYFPGSGIRDSVTS